MFHFHSSVLMCFYATWKIDKFLFLGIHTYKICLHKKDTCNPIINYFIYECYSNNGKKLIQLSTATIGNKIWLTKDSSHSTWFHKTVTPEELEF